MSRLRARGLAVVRKLGGATAQSRLEQRAASLDGFALLDWAEATVPGVGRALNDWGRTGAVTSLDEARMGTAALLVVLDELYGRTAEGYDGQ